MNNNFEHAALKKNIDQLKKVSCPRCDSRVANSDWDIDTEVQEVSETEFWKADYFIKCWRCKALLGIKKLNQVS